MDTIATGLPQDWLADDIASVVTAVIEDEHGQTVRHWLNATALKPGDPMPTWDGLDDRGRSMPAGIYRLRGLKHQGLNIHYELHAYNDGAVPWTAGPDAEGVLGGWGADHGAPSAVAVDPSGRDARVFAAFTGQEAGSWLLALDGEGRKVGADSSTWKGGHYLAVDGSGSVPMVYYASDEGVWPGKPSWHLQAATWPAKASAPRLLDYKVEGSYDAKRGKHHLSGLAAHRGQVFVSLHYADTISVYRFSVIEDGFTHERDLHVQQPRGLAIDRNGRLAAVSGRSIVRVDPDTGEVTPWVGELLEGPWTLTVDPRGHAFVADLGDGARGDPDRMRGPQTIHEFSPDGSAVRVYGLAGGRTIGPYDPEAIGLPTGLAVDGLGQLWVAEREIHHKRFSVWDTATGRYVREHLGPPRYGATGTLDPNDPARLFIGPMEWRIDWDAGQASPHFWHGDHLTDASSGMSTIQILHHGGHEYRINFNGASFWLRNTEIHRLDPATGRHIPAAIVGVDRPRQLQTAWSDRNHDGQTQPEERQEWSQLPDGSAAFEVQYSFVGPDLTYYAVGNHKWKRWSLWKLPPREIDARGVPHYDLSDAVEIIREVPQELFVKGLRLMWVDAEGGMYVIGWDARPAQAVANLFRLDAKGTLQWTLPLRSEGHAEYNLKLPAGNIIHIHKLAGMASRPGPELGELGPTLCAVTADGQRHFFTSDGLYVGAVFHNRVRDGGVELPRPLERGISLNNAYCPDEQWGDHFVQTRDGRLLLLTGVGPGPSGVTLAEITGMDKAVRLPDRHFRWSGDTTSIASEDIASPATRLTIRRGTPTLDGDLGEWEDDPMVNVPLNATQGFSAALRSDGTNLYAAWRVTGSDALTNAGGDWRTLFKSGGGVDLHLDLPGSPRRVFITRVEGQPVCVLYQLNAPDEPAPAVFESPVGRVQFDLVKRLEDARVVIRDGSGFHTIEAAIPWSVLGGSPRPATDLRGDVGVIFADPTGTKGLVRHYWANRHTSIVDDLPTEATLQPEHWNPITLEPSP